MLKTNSKAARENLMKYIMQDLDYLEERRSYDIETGNAVYDLTKDANICAYIWDIFRSEHKRGFSQKDFEEWASGLALGNLFCYYYMSAVDILGDILEETEAERSRYTEEAAENLLTSLIYREIMKRKSYAEEPVIVESTEGAQVVA